MIILATGASSAKFYTKLACKWDPATPPAPLDSFLSPHSTMDRDSSGENSSWKNWAKNIFHSFILRSILLWWLKLQTSEKKKSLPLFFHLEKSFYQTIPNMPWIFHVNEFLSSHYFCVATDKFLSSPLEKHLFFFIQQLPFYFG